ncbi:MAG: tetratricopeptide repeat protein [Methanobrevibacter sp.]|jgi:tetratricopeptide (TPR) repeat protein|nr:tetratricopeptide repeat protein [Candidatus Methanovirga meridionalis]
MEIFIEEPETISDKLKIKSLIKSRLEYEIKLEKEFEKEMNTKIKICETMVENEELTIKLKNAKKEYKNKNYDKAIELYKPLHENHPENFNKWDSICYAWSLYYTHIKDSNGENLNEIVELITILTKQKDLSKKDEPCVYTISLMKVIEFFSENKNFDEVIYWTDKLDPNLLSDDSFTFTDNSGKERNLPSKKENWFVARSKAHFELEDFEDAIKISEKALENISKFRYDNDIWFKRRIALSNNRLGNHEIAVELLKEVLLVKKEWYIQKELADTYYNLNHIDESLKYAIDAALNFGEPDKKIKLYSLLESLLFEKGMESEAKLHAELVYQIRNKNQWHIDDKEIERLKKLDINTEKNIRPESLENILRRFWEDLKYKNQESYKGTIDKILPNRKAGFIKRNFSTDSYYFNFNSFKGNKKSIKEGLSVFFYLEESFDKKKNKKTFNAVNIIS